MPLSKEQVKHVARLARLKLSLKETEEYTRELTTILNYIDQLKSVNTEEVPAWNQSATMENVFREDEIRLSLPREKVLGNAANRDDEYFHVPRVIGR